MKTELFQNSIKIQWSIRVVLLITVMSGCLSNDLLLEQRGKLMSAWMLPLNASTSRLSEPRS